MSKFTFVPTKEHLALTEYSAEGERVDFIFPGVNDGFVVMENVTFKITHGSARIRPELLKNGSITPYLLTESGRIPLDAVTVDNGAVRPDAWAMILRMSNQLVSLFSHSSTFDERLGALDGAVFGTKIF
jgi:hypothetical protein